MSGLSISAYFPFRRINISHQKVNAEATDAQILARADLRFKPVCQACGNEAPGAHSWTRRKIRDLNMASETFG